MAIIQSTNTSSRTYSKIENDVYEARITRVLIIGSQPRNAYKGTPKPDAVVGKVAFELICETVTCTDGDEVTEMPAIVYKDYVLPQGGSTMGHVVAMLGAALGMKETPADTQAYAQLINAGVQVDVGSYIGKKDGVERTCVNGVSSMGKKAKEKLDQATTTSLFFDCYQDDDESKVGFTKLGNFARDKMAAASDSMHMPAVTQGWPSELAADGSDASSPDEF